MKYQDALKSSEQNIRRIAVWADINGAYVLSFGGLLNRLCWEGIIDIETSRCY